jgi:hypothetical protein
MNGGRSGMLAFQIAGASEPERQARLPWCCHQATARTSRLADEPRLLRP